MLWAATFSKFLENYYSLECEIKNVLYRLSFKKVNNINEKNEKTIIFFSKMFKFNNDFSNCVKKYFSRRLYTFRENDSVYL